jgi:hypothetical protein
MPPQQSRALELCENSSAPATPTSKCTGPVYRARYYDPVRGRFIGQDPIGLLGGDLNPYAYVGSSPLNWVDPMGWDKQAGSMSQSGCGPPTTRKCSGMARVVQGNPRHIGSTRGAFAPRPISSTSAAVIPQQFGVSVSGGLRPFAGQIRGTVGGTFDFTDVADVVGPPSAREKLQQRNPEKLILELPGVPKDMGVTSVVISVPAALPCPTGTTEVATPIRD